MAGKSRRSLWADKLAGKPLAKPVAVDFRLKESYQGVVLGIDPSLRGTGLALLDFKGGGEVVLVASETVRVPSSRTQAECLGRISGAVSQMLSLADVRHVAIEETIYVQNFKTAQIMGMARGAAMGVVGVRGVPVYEYAPLRIKKAVVGTGRASKDQMAGMVAQHLGQVGRLASDEADAAGAALCHAFTWEAAE